MSQLIPPSSDPPDSQEPQHDASSNDALHAQSPHKASSPDHLSPDHLAPDQTSAVVPPVLPQDSVATDASNNADTHNADTHDTDTRNTDTHEADTSLADSIIVTMPVSTDRGTSPLPAEAGTEQISDKHVDSHQNAVAHYPSTPPPSKLRKRRRKDPSPRFLVIVFCLWLLGAWFVALESSSMVQPIRWMVLCAFLCVMAFWPVLRLSQYRDIGDTDNSCSADSYRSAGRLFIDWLCLNLVFQTIIWPLHLNAQWHTTQTWWISATLASWSLITGAIIALGCRSDRAIHRTLATLLCVMLLFGEPVLLVLLRWLPGMAGQGLASGQITFHTSPLALVWSLTNPAATWSSQPWVTQVPAAALAGLTGWLVVIATRRWAGQSTEPMPPARSIDATLP